MKSVYHPIYLSALSGRIEHFSIHECAMVVHVHFVHVYTVTFSPYRRATLIEGWTSVDRIDREYMYLSALSGRVEDLPIHECTMIVHVHFVHVYTVISSP